MHAQLTRTLAAAAVFVGAAAIVVAGPGAPSAQALGVCPGSLCGPQGMAVLAASDAMDSAVVAGSAGASAVGTTAGTAAGVGGVSFASSAAGGTAGLIAGAAAWLGIKGWKAGSMTVAPGGATGVTGGAGVPAGWIGSNVEHITVDPSYGSTITWTVTENSPTSWTVVGHYVPDPGKANVNTSPVDWGCNNNGSVSRVSFGTNQGAGTNVTRDFSWNIACTAPAVPWDMRTWNGTGYSTYDGLANPARPPAQPSGGGTVTQHLHCVGANGATQDLTQTFQANVASAGSFTFPDLTCPAGMVAGSFSADLTPSTGAAPQPLIPTTTAPSTVTSIPTNEPGCVDSACTLRLFRSANATQGTTATDCGDYAMACPDWYTDPSRSSNYECHWGPYVVTLDQCSVYRVPGEILPNTKVNADGTATYVLWPPLPAPASSSDPSPSSQGCLPSGWSAFNPIEWVLLPSECALRWAFVPSSGFMTAQVTQLQSDVGTRAPFSVIAVVPAAVSGLSSGWSAPCSSLPNFSTLPDHPLRMACSPPDSPGWHAAYVLMGVLVWVSGVFALWRMAHHAVGGSE